MANVTPGQVAEGMPACTPLRPDQRSALIARIIEQSQKLTPAQQVELDQLLAGLDRREKPYP